MDNLKNQPKNIAEKQSLDQEGNLDENARPSQGSISRRSFLRQGFIAGSATLAASVLPTSLVMAASGGLSKGDIAILRFLSAAEIIETDLWQQYNELGGIQDPEVPGGS